MKSLMNQQKWVDDTGEVNPSVKKESPNKNFKIISKKLENSEEFIGPVSDFNDEKKEEK